MLQGNTSISKIRPLTRTGSCVCVSQAHTAVHVGRGQASYFGSGGLGLRFVGRGSQSPPHELGV